MNRSARWGIPALAAAAIVPIAGPATPAAAEPDEPILSNCSTEALTLEAVADGATSVIECFDEPQARRGSVLLARLYVGASGAGFYLDAYGPSCSGYATELAGTGWDNTIHSTRTKACTNVKHFASANLMGDSEVVSGPYNTLGNLTTLAGSVTSVGYGS